MFAWSAHARKPFSLYLSLFLFQINDEHQHDSIVKIAKKEKEKRDDLVD